MFISIAPKPKLAKHSDMNTKVNVEKKKHDSQVVKSQETISEEGARKTNVSKKIGKVGQRWIWT